VNLSTYAAPKKQRSQNRACSLNMSFDIFDDSCCRWDGWMPPNASLPSLKHPARIVSYEDPDETRIMLRCRVILIMPKNSDIAPNPVSRRVRATASLPQLLPLFLRRV